MTRRDETDIAGHDVCRDRRDTEHLSKSIDGAVNGRQRLAYTVGARRSTRLLAARSLCSVFADLLLPSALFTAALEMSSCQRDTNGLLKAGAFAGLIIR